MGRGLVGVIHPPGAVGSRRPASGCHGGLRRLPGANVTGSERGAAEMLTHGALGPAPDTPPASLSRRASGTPTMSGTRLGSSTLGASGLRSGALQAFIEDLGDGRHYLGGGAVGHHGDAPLGR